MLESLQGRGMPREFVISRRSGNVTSAVLKEPTDSRDRMCGHVQLCVVGIEVWVDSVSIRDNTEISGVQHEQERAQHRALGDATV